MTRSTVASALAIAVASASTYASETNKTKAVEETFVWGTSVKSSSVYLGEQDISLKQADHLSDILREVPGVDIGGTHSVNTRINIRGLDDRDLAIYIDGALQTNYLYHHMGNLLINPDILKSADIELGANSVLHGGLGGSLRFETKEAKELLRDGARFGGRVLMSYHSNAQVNRTLTNYVQVSEKLDLLVYDNFTNRHNFTDGSGQDVIGNDGETNNLLLKVGYDFSENQRLELSADIYRDRGDYGQRPDMGYQAASGLSGGLDIPLFDTEYDRNTYNLGYDGQFNTTSIEANAYINSMRLYRDESDGLISPFGTVVPSTEKQAEADNFGLNVLAKTLVGNNSLSYGIEYFSQSFDFDQDLNSDAQEHQKQDATLLAIFAEDRISITDSFHVTPGLRFNQYDMDVEQTGLDESWNNTSWALALDWRVYSDLEFVASYTELFKGPELAEPFQGGGGVLVANSDLKPEEGDNIEIGVRYTNELSSDSAINFGVNLFETTIENYITQEALSDESGNEQYVNSGTAVIDGFEASANYYVGKLDMLLTYARSELDGKDLEVNDTDTTESLREIGDSITFNINYDLSQDLSAHYDLLLVKDKERHFGGNDKPGYKVHNVSIAYTPSSVKGLTLIAGVDNIFDKEYTSHASREGIAPFTTPPTVLNDIEPGRNIKLSVSYDF